MAYGTLPVLSGVTLRRPSDVSEEPEQVGTTVSLANGSERRYDLGERFVFSLGWRSMTESQVAELRAAAGRGVLPYVHVDGGLYSVLVVDRPKVTPVAGTDPTRFAVTLALREQRPVRR